jgi:hypothetical protein
MERTFERKMGKMVQKSNAVFRQNIGVTRLKCKLHSAEKRLLEFWNVRENATHKSVELRRVVD